MRRWLSEDFRPLEEPDGEMIAVTPALDERRLLIGSELTESSLSTRLELSKLLTSSKSESESGTTAGDATAEEHRPLLARLRLRRRL